MEPESLSKQIKAFRKEYNLTQQNLAFKSGVGLRFLRELEQGKSAVCMINMDTYLIIIINDLVMMILGYVVLKFYLKESKKTGSLSKF